MSKNVILADCNVDESWEFKRALEQSIGQKWDILKCITNRYHGSRFKVLKRYILYFVFSFQVFLNRGRYEQVMAWQQFYGLLLAFFCRLFRVKKSPKIYVMTFIYKSKNAFYYRFIKYIVTSGYITKLIVLSDEEKKYYAELFNISEELFYCTRIGVSDISNKVKVKTDRKKYYLAVGRSNRDYKFLCDAWKKEYGDLIVICDSYKEEEKEGITCLRSCYGNEYIEYVANCYAQIIPLEDANISSGSLSFLQAMMLSRPSIVTENVTVHDYIQNGYNGMIIEKSVNELEKAIKKMEDKSMYMNLCYNARITYEMNYSEMALGNSVAEMLNKIKS